MPLPTRNTPLRIDWLDAPSLVGLTLAPGQHRDSTEGFRWERDVETDLAALVAAGVRVLVGLIEDSEIEDCKLQTLYPRAQALGLELLRLPIEDGRTPTDWRAVEALLDAIDAREAEGKRVVIHCMGGLGRTGTIAGCYLARRGLSHAKILETLVRVRKDRRCPENDAQKQYIADYAATRPKPASPTRTSTEVAPSWYETLFGDPSTWDALAARAVRTPDQGPVSQLLGAIEREVRTDPARAFAFDGAGFATLAAAGKTYAAGRFTTPTIGELRARLAGRVTSDAKLTVSALSGSHPLTDIGALQGTAGPADLFQVASQFNGLEAPDACIVPVVDYLHDYTQGPRASVSAFPGVLLRHYSAPTRDGKGRFAQSEAAGLNLLADVFDDAVAEVKCGYLQSDAVHDRTAFAEALVTRFDHARVGVHEGVEVVYGHDWSGPVVGHRRIAQVLTSTIAQGGYGRDDGSAELATARRQLLRAAYLGTLLAAADLGRTHVVLTLIGGGVFGNPLSDIWDAIFWAADTAQPLLRGELTAVVNSRPPLKGDVREQVIARGGRVVDVAR